MRTFENSAPNTLDPSTVMYPPFAPNWKFLITGKTVFSTVRFLYSPLLTRTYDMSLSNIICLTYSLMITSYAAVSTFSFSTTLLRLTLKVSPLLYARVTVDLFTLTNVPVQRVSRQKGPQSITLCVYVTVSPIS